MKKIMAIISLIIIGASLGLYQYYYGGSSYYTKIVDSGTEITQTVDTTKEEYQDYRYEQLAFNEKGEERHVEFNGTVGRPLKIDAYLKLKYNRMKGVLSWEEIDSKDVPEKALTKLN